MNLTAITFDMGNARACARASADAYQQTTISIAATDTHCLVVDAGDCYVIAFRGTNPKSIRNWITDARVNRNHLRITLHITSDGSDVQVHSGFLAAFDSIASQLSQFLGWQPSFNIQNCKPIFITGHSLGGALAILAAEQLSRQGFQILQVYTFGQPRVGNGAFKALYEKTVPAKTFRVVYQEDIVPRLPHLPAWHDLYVHAGVEIFVPSDMPGRGSALWFDPPLWRLLISDAWGIYRAWCVSKFKGAIDPVVDHQMFHYIAALNQAQA